VESDEDMGSMTALWITIGFVAAAFTVIWLVCGPKRSNGAQEQVQAAGEKPIPKNDGKNVRSAAPTQNRETHAQSSIDGERRTQEKAKKCKECWTLGIEIGAFIGLSAYAYITYQMWGEMHQQTIESNRAWLAVKSLNPKTDHPLILGQPIFFSIPLENSGRQPATDIDLRLENDEIDIVSDIASLPKIANNTCDEKNSPIPFEGIVYPTSGSGENVPVTFLSTSGKGPVVFDGDLQQSKKFYRIRGCFTYVTFKARHHSWFCYFYAYYGNLTPNTFISQCPTGLGAD
jgi:hypothetical protein